MTLSPRSICAALLLLLFLHAPSYANAPEAGSGAMKPGESYGAAIELRDATPLADLLAHPERFADQKVLIRGRISDVCQRKGCWTVLQDGSAHVRVRFEDYGFFLPKDSMGKEAYAEGRVQVSTLSEKEARHYESESRDGDPSKIQGPQRTVGFMASGVRILQN